MEFEYTLEAVFAVFRITLGFLLLFGIIAPWLLDYPRELPAIERLIYSWVGLVGIIIFSILVLAALNIYDVISIVLTLLLIPPVRSAWAHRQEGVLNYVKRIEFKAVLQQVRLLEQSPGVYWARMKKKAVKKTGYFFLMVKPDLSSHCHCHFRRALAHVPGADQRGPFVARLVFRA